MKDDKLSDIVSLAKRRGFVYQGSEIYGGLAGTYDYGPLGTVLKRNIINAWLKMFVDGRDDMYQVDSAILMNPKVWQASGHVDTFTDPMIECMHCHLRFRADKIDLSTPCPNCGTKDKFSKPEQFNMMFKTVVGPKYTSWDRKESGGLEARVVFKKEDGTPEKEFDLKDDFSELGGFMFYDSKSISYLRPETAQGMFTNFKNVVDSVQPDMPFGMAQVGKAFRNEISPRDFIFRAREFEQMEIEYFVHPDQWQEKFEHWLADIESFLKTVGLPEDRIHKLEVEEKDRAHYSQRTVDFEFDFPHGREELLGLAYRTDFDLKNIEKASGKSMQYRPKDGSEPFVPHVIEPSFGVERLIMAILTSSYTEDEQNGEKRIYLKLPNHLAPVKAAVSPLLKNKLELVNKAREVYEMLRKANGDGMLGQRSLGEVVWDDNGNIGKRYRRQDEIGTPYCITIDFQSLEDDSVTVRNRDTTEQTRIQVSDLVSQVKT